MKQNPQILLCLSLSCPCTWVSQLKCKRCNAVMTAYPILPMAWRGAHTCVSPITFDRLECCTPLQTRVAPSYQSPLASTATLCSLATRHHPTLDTNVRISLNVTQTRLPLATLFGPQTRAPLGLGAPSAQRTEGAEFVQGFTPGLRAAPPKMTRLGTQRGRLNLNPLTSSGLSREILLAVLNFSPGPFELRACCGYLRQEGLEKLD